MDERKLDIKVRMSSDELSNDIKRAKNELGTFQSEVRKTDAELKAYGKSTDLLENKQKALEKAISSQEDQMQSLSIAYERSVKATGEASKESLYLAKQMNNLGTSLAKNKGELSKVQSELAQMSDSSKNAGQGVETFEQKMKNADTTISNYQSELKKTSAEAKLFGNSQDSLKNKMSSLESLYSAQSNKMDLLNSAYEKQVRESGQASNAAQELKTKINNLSAEMTNTKSSINETSNALNGLDNAGSKGGENGPFTGVIKGAKALVALEIAQKVTEISGKIKDFAGEALNSFNQVQGSQQKLQNSFGLTGKEAEQLTTIARGLARDGFAPSMEEASTALQMVRTNIKDLDNQGLQTITQQAIMLEKTFGMDMNETMRGVNALMVNFGLTAEQAMDLMTVGAQNGLDKTHELGDNMAEYAQLWSQMGYSANDTFAMLQSGLDAGAYNLDKVNDLVKEMGISLTDGRFVKNADMFSKSTQDLFKKWQEGGASQKDVINSMIQDFGKMDGQYEQLNRAGTVWSALGEDNSMKVIQALGKTGTAYDDVAGAAKKATDNSVTDVEKMKGAFEDLKVGLAPIGEAIAKALLPFIEGLKSLGDKFKKLSPGMKSFISQALIIGAVVGTLVAVIVPIVAGFLAFGAIVATVGISLGAFIGIVAAVAAAVAAIIAVILNWGSIVDWLKGVWDGFTSWLSDLWSGIVDIASSVWQSVSDAIVSVWDSFISTISSVFDGIKTWFEGVWTGFIEIASKAWDGIIKAILVVLEGAWNLIMIPIQLILTGIILLWELFKATAQGIWSLIGDTIINIWNNIVSVASTIWSGLTEILSTIWNGIVSIATTVWTSVSTAIIAVWNGIKDFASSIWNAVTEVITNVWNTIASVTSAVWATISSVISSVWSTISSIVSNAINTILSLISNVWNTISSVTSSVWNAISSVISSVMSVISSIVSNAVNVIRNVISSAWNAISSVTSSVWNAISSVISAIWGRIQPTVSAGVNAVRNVVSSAWNAISSVTSSVWNSITGVINGAVGGIRSAISSISGVIGGVASAFSGLYNTIAGVMDNIVSKISAAWDKAGSILSKLNPFKAEDDDEFDFDDSNPYGGYTPTGSGALLSSNDISSSMSNVMAAVGNATNSIRSGVFSTMANMNAIRNNKNSNIDHVRKQEQEKDYRKVEYSVEVPLYLDSKEVARATAKFTQEELDQKEKILDLIKGKGR